MKKFLFIMCLLLVVLAACLKPKEDVQVTNTNQQILIKVDAEHNDGGIVSSPIVVVR
jgi:hypothetical protein